VREGQGYDRAEYGAKLRYILDAGELMSLKETVKPITYLKNNTSEVVREAQENGRLLIVTQNGEAKAVVMGVAQYDEWKKALALLKILAMGESDVAAGRTVSQEEAFRRAEAALKRRAADE
jgi:prevent-host-death family protein